jgi:hypothetical protein
MNGMKYFDEKASADLGEAIGRLLGMYDRIKRGDIAFTLDEVEKIGKATELLSSLQEEEIVELFRLAGEE